MNIIVTKNYDEMSKVAADIVIGQLKSKKDTILGLATGSTPVGLYRNMINACKNKEVSFAQVKSFNLDEYYRIDKSDSQSYDYFMRENLFNHIDIKDENIDIPNGEAEDFEAECKRYDKAIEDAGGVDIQVLGIGNNGHIGFNEPDDELFCGTHKTALTESTIEANKRFFDSADLVPRSALTMGMKTIMQAKKIVILISGSSKANVAKKLLEGKITTQVPATMLHFHPDVTLIIDEDAHNG